MQIVDRLKGEPHVKLAMFTRDPREHVESVSDHHT